MTVTDIKEEQLPQDEAIDEFDEMEEIIGDFLIEADELITSLDSNLVTLEDTPDDLDLLNEIFRAAHTIKGTSGFLGLDTIMALTHKMEDILNKLRKGELHVTGDIMDVLLESVDMLKLLLEDVSEKREVVRDIIPLGARLALAMEQKDGDLSEQDKVTEASASVEAPSIGSTPEPASTGSKPSVGKASRGGVPKINREETIRVDVSRLDNLMNLMGELVLGRNSLIQTTNMVTKQHENLSGLDELTRAGTQINFITTEIQMAVMKMRMLPVGKVFSKFPRMVRDLSRESSKKITLEIFGEETELDKSVIEQIGDPLVHLIRNSCDHGIEPPEERLAAGKPEAGTIKLGASQEGSNIVITISDDGRGLDVAAIKLKALEKGLATPQEIERLAEREIFGFIFQPGFSTAKKVTDISGRGVGMDVVKTNIEKLKGLIDISSTKGTGTTINIKLPLTLAIVQGLLVVSHDETFIIPLSSVLETLRVNKEEIESVNRREVITLRDGVLPIVDLNQILKGGTAVREEGTKPYVVVVGLAEQRLGLIVDELLGQEEVVIKTMGQFLGKTQGVAGATILGDGRVRLIVDLMGLFELARK